MSENIFCESCGSRIGRKPKEISYISKKENFLSSFLLALIPTLVIPLMFTIVIWSVNGTIKWTVEIYYIMLGGFVGLFTFYFVAGLINNRKYNKKFKIELADTLFEDS